jgi:hypothetical protein
MDLGHCTRWPWLITEADFIHISYIGYHLKIKIYCDLCYCICIGYHQCYIGYQPTTYDVTYPRHPWILTLEGQLYDKWRPYVMDPTPWWQEVDYQCELCMLGTLELCYTICVPIGQYDIEIIGPYPRPSWTKVCKWTKLYMTRPPPWSQEVDIQCVHLHGYCVCLHAYPMCFCMDTLCASACKS